MTEKKVTIVDDLKVPEIGSQWRRRSDERTFEVKQIEYSTEAYDVEVITGVVGGSYDDDGLLETWRHTLRRFHDYHTPVSQIVEGVVEPMAGSKWRDRETGRIVIVKLVGRSGRFAGQFVTFEREDLTGPLVLPLRNFHTEHEPMPDEESQPVTHAFLTTALQVVQGRLEDVIAQSMEEVLDKVHHMIAAKERAEPVPDDLPRKEQWAATPRALERIRAEVYEHGYAVGNKEGYKRGVEDASVRTGPHVTPDGAYYTPKEIEVIKEEARNSGFEAGRVAAHDEYRKDAARGVYYTQAELEAIEDKARQKAIADTTKVRAHLILALQDATSALMDLGTLVIQGPNEKNAGKRGGVAIGLRRAAHRVQHGSMTGFDDKIDPGLADAEKRIKELTQVAERTRTAIFERNFLNDSQWVELYDLLTAVIEAKPDSGTMSRE